MTKKKTTFFPLSLSGYEIYSTFLFFISIRVPLTGGENTLIDHVIVIFKYQTWTQGTQV